MSPGRAFKPARPGETQGRLQDTVRQPTAFRCSSTLAPWTATVRVSFAPEVGSWAVTRMVPSFPIWKVTSSGDPSGRCKSGWKVRVPSWMRSFAA